MNALAPVVTTVKPVVDVVTSARPARDATVTPSTTQTSARPSLTAATRGGAAPSKDADGTTAATDHGLGSPAAVGRNGGVEDGRQAGVTAGAVTTGPAAAKRSPATAPPVVSAANRSTSTPAHARGAADSAADPLPAAGLRDDNLRRAVPLPIPGAVRSGSAHPDARPTTLPVQPVPEAPHAPAATAGGSAAAASSVPPPAAASMLFAAALAAAAAIFCVLVMPPAYKRPVPFISLLERPG